MMTFFALKFRRNGRHSSGAESPQRLGRLAGEIGPELQKQFGAAVAAVAEDIAKVNGLSKANSLFTFQLDAAWVSGACNRS
jgi:hypothetical protein